MGWNETKDAIGNAVKDLIALTGDVRVLAATTESAVAEVNRRIDTAESRIERRASDVEAHCDRHDQALESRLVQQAASLESRLNDRVTAFQSHVEVRLMDFESRLRTLEKEISLLNGFMGQVQGQAVATIVAQVQRDALLEKSPTRPDGD